MQQIIAKQILVRNKCPQEWFDISWNMNLYRGCNHGCIYCDSRSTCYQVKHFNEMEIKLNAIEILRQELISKQKNCTIGTGSMSDPYNSHEAEWQYTRQALFLLAEYGFPVHINTKGVLITRDLDVLQKINAQTLASVAFSFSTPDDKLAAVIEPGAPSPSQRLMAMQILAQQDIYTGLLYTPILPLITDTEAQVKQMLTLAAEHGASYVLTWFGLTLREGSREYYYQALDSGFPGLKEQYKQLYGNKYICTSHREYALGQILESECAKHGLVYKMPQIKTYDKLRKAEQLTIF